MRLNSCSNANLQRNGARNSKKRLTRSVSPKRHIGVRDHKPISVTVEDILPRTLDQRQHSNGSSRSHEVFGTAEGGLYDQYQHAIQNFRDELDFLALPSQRPLRTVLSLSRAADYVLSTCVSKFGRLLEENPPKIVTMSLLRHLKTSIGLRETIMAGMGAAVDERHKFMLKTLYYCFDILKLARNCVRNMRDNIQRTRIGGTRGGDSSDDDYYYDDEFSDFGHPFYTLLALEDDDGDDTEYKRTVRDYKRKARKNIPFIPRPKATDLTKTLSMDDLLCGDDMFQAIAFLLSMNQLMETIESHYALLKQHTRGHSDHEGYSSSLQLLMQATVAANVSVQTVKNMETRLSTEHPHLRSFYHVLALVFLFEAISEIEERVAPSRLIVSPSIVKEFVGDICASCFHNAKEIKPSLLQNFVDTTGLEAEYVEAMSSDINQMVMFEIQLRHEVSRNMQLNQVMEQNGLKPHIWFKTFENIGNQYSILNTQNLLQKVLDVTHKSKKLVAVDGFFGPSWDEENNPAQATRGDMDQVFAAEILPELMELAKYFPFSRIRNTQELLPVLTLLSAQMKKKRGSPVPVSLTFGFHAMLISMLKMQGSEDVKSLGHAAKISFELLLGQLRSGFEEMEKNQRNGEGYMKQGFTVVSPLSVIAKPIGTPSRDTSEMTAFWNPIMAGSYLLFGTYLSSIGLGAVTIDCMAQLRFVLHLYNALKQQGLVWKIGLLDDLDRIFERTKAVWVAGRPERGSYVKMFWLSLGLLPVGPVSRRTFDTPKTWLDISPSINRFTSRPLEEIQPRHFSSSYRHVILRDFSKELESFSDFSDDFRARTMLSSTSSLKGDFRKRSMAKMASCSDRDFRSGSMGIKNHNSSFRTSSSSSSSSMRDFKNGSMLSIASSTTTEFLDTPGRINIIREAMDQDEENRITAINFPLIGLILNDFVVHLSRHMRWDELVRELLASCPLDVKNGPGSHSKRGQDAGVNDELSTTASITRDGSFASSLERYVLAHLWVTEILGVLDFHDVSAAKKEECRKAATFMTDFFRSLPRESYVFINDAL